MSCANKLRIKQGYITDFTATVKDSSGTVVDLSSFDSVNFVMEDFQGNVIVNSPASFILPKTDGKVTYGFQTADVATIGTFRAYFGFKVGSTNKLSGPTSYFSIEIIDDLLP